MADNLKSNNKNIIEPHDIVKSFFIGKPNELEIVHGININIKEGEFTSIVGESGSGKSTLMNIIGALDKPTAEKYYLGGIDICNAKDKQLSEIINKHIVFVFQTYNLVARSTAISNVELPMLYAGVPKGKRNARAKELLEMVGMQDRMQHKSDELSGGQKQRVAIARTMANDPSIILADEPTGALDSKTGRIVMDIFHELNEKQKKTIVLITHSMGLAKETDRIITLKDGIITGEKINDGSTVYSSGFNP